MLNLSRAVKALPICLFGLFVLSGVAFAQPVKPDSAEATAAMERAQRLAANPMRVILQASKFKRKAAEASESADDVPLRRAPVRVAAAVETPPPEPAAAVAATAAATAAAPAAAAKAQPASRPITVTGTLDGDATLAKPGAAVAALQSAAPVESVFNVPNAPGSLAAPLSVPLAAFSQPKLVEMIEPAIPARLLVDGTAVKEVVADLTIRADGSVASVALVSPVPRPWQRYVLAAFERWRFEPLPAQRVHRVQLVFSDQ